MDNKNIGVKFKVLGFLFSTFLGVALFSSCKKEDPTMVTITVNNQDNLRVEGAFVRVYGKPSDSTRSTAPEDIRFDETRTTDGSGQVSFNYTDFTKPGQAGFAVLDIEVTKFDVDPEDPSDTTYLYGIGQVRVEEEKNNTKTIRIQ